jgi:hypothetical protein
VQYRCGVGGAARGWCADTAGRCGTCSQHGRRPEFWSEAVTELGRPPPQPIRTRPATGTQPNGSDYEGQRAENRQPCRGSAELLGQGPWVHASRMAHMGEGRSDMAWSARWNRRRVVRRTAQVSGVGALCALATGATALLLTVGHRGVDTATLVTAPYAADPGHGPLLVDTPTPQPRSSGRHAGPTVTPAWRGHVDGPGSASGHRTSPGRNLPGNGSAGGPAAGGAAAHPATPLASPAPTQSATPRATPTYPMVLPSPAPSSARPTPKPSVRPTHPASPSPSPKSTQKPASKASPQPALPHPNASPRTAAPSPSPSAHKPPSAHRPYRDRARQQLGRQVAARHWHHHHRHPHPHPHQERSALGDSTLGDPGQGHPGQGHSGRPGHSGCGRAAQRWSSVLSDSRTSAYARS